jgi:hypothetical protein
MVKHVPILTKPMKKYLLGSDKRGYGEETQRAYNRRIIDYAKRGLKDLLLLAEKLPEEAQAEVFNEETLAPLMRNLFRLIVKERVEVVDIPEINRKELEKRRTRVLALCYAALNEIGDVFNARNLAPDVMEILMEAGLSETLSTITGLKAVYIKGFSPRRQLKPTH